MRKTLVWLSLLVVMLSLAAPVWAVEADGVGGEEETLDIGRQVVIAEQVKQWENIATNDDIAATGVKDYDPAKLVVGESIPVYYYTDRGFELRYIYYPVLFEDHLFMMVGERSGSFSYNDLMDRWLQKAGVKVDCPLAIVWDYSNTYYYDGSQWHLFHHGDVHMRFDDLPEMDVEKVSGEGMELRAMNQRLTPLADAYYGRLSLEQQVEVEEFRQEMAKAQEEAEVRALQELERNMRAAGFVPIFVNGEMSEFPGTVAKGQVVVDPMYGADILGLSLSTDDGYFVYSNGAKSLRLHWRDGWLNQDNKTIGQLKMTRVNNDYYVGIRDLAEFFGMQVRWDKAGGRVLVTSK